MKYFVTGGCGFIGANYVNYLLNTVPGVSKVTVYDKFTYAANPRNLEDHKFDPRLEVVKGDICDYKSLEKAMYNHDFVVHLAAESHVDRSISNSTEFIETNLVGTHNVLGASMINNVKTFIHVSTDEVYGSLNSGTADENCKLFPNSPYSASKAGSDLLVKSFFATYGIDVRITRCSNNFGRYQFPEKVIPVFVNALIKNKKAPIYGNGKNIREWLHVSDHCRAIQLVLEKGLSGETYNVGSGFYLSNLDLAKNIIEILGLKEDMIQFVSDRKGHDYRYAVNYDKIKQLGYKPEKDFYLSLKDTVDWYKNNQNWWPEV
jgi:dTDP-glucose 4,6-dehydratase